MSAAAIRLVDLTLGYDRHPAVHHLDGVFAAGSLTAVVGPNGAGKSTLLKAIAGTLRPLEGRVEPGSAGPQPIAYLPQQSEIDRSMPLAVLDLVVMGHWRRVGWFGGIGRELLAAGRRALQAVGLAGFEARPLGTLSGGQLQRVLFARVLVQDCPLILLDEPFTAIDQRTTADLLDLVRRWHGEGHTVIAVLHDLEVVRAVFPDTLLLARDPVSWGPTGEALQPANLLRARRLAEAWRDDAAPCARSRR